MSEQCEWVSHYTNPPHKRECGNQTAFDDRFCPAHQQTADENGVSHVNPLASIAELFKTHEIKLVAYSQNMPVQEHGYRVTITEKGKGE